MKLGPGKHETKLAARQIALDRLHDDVVLSALAELAAT
jgi:hypothetical protein